MPWSTVTASFADNRTASASLGATSTVPRSTMNRHTLDVSHSVVNSAPCALATAVSVRSSTIAGSLPVVPGRCSARPRSRPTAIRLGDEA